MSRHPGGARPGLRTGVLIAGLSLLVFSCGYTRIATSHKDESPSTRPYFCNAVGDGTPPGGHGGNGSHVHPIYEGMTKGKLSWEDCLKLSNQLDSALAAVQEVRTAGDAEAAGWRNYAGYIPGLGTHHSQELIPGLTPKPFDPSKPDFLIYGGPGDDAPIVGVGYAAPGTEQPPEAFAGDNDWWHLHRKICLENGRILAGAEELSDEECDALGGNQFTLPDGGTWLLHLWIPPYELRFDMFASGHPCLGADSPLPKEDSCWEEIANHGPADGPLPGTDHGEHDDHGEHGH